MHRVPAVWHKEILWAMQQGIHVFGSAGMGALRAAELAAFGMCGVGRVFQAYAETILEDDDDVAVACGSAETGYARLSEAMVNIQATLASAEKGGVLGVAARTALERIAKALSYPDRSWEAILRCAAVRDLAPAELQALQDWLSHGRVDVTRQDALAMLRLMREHLAAAPEPKRVTYEIEHTTNWDTAMRYWEQSVTMPRAIP
jgi:hypothetical protein